MKHLIIFALISLICVVSAQDDPACIAKAEKVEMGMKKLLLIGKGSKIPRTIEDINNRCKYVISKRNDLLI